MKLRFFQLNVFVTSMVEIELVLPRKICQNSPLNPFSISCVGNLYPSLYTACDKIDIQLKKELLIRGKQAFTRTFSDTCYSLFKHFYRQGESFLKFYWWNTL